MHHSERPNPCARGSAFTLVELAVILSLLVILAGVLVTRVGSRRAAGRDARRLQDLQRIQDAIERFHAENGRYPAPRGNASCGGWDVSFDGDLIPELVTQGFLAEVPADPINDATYHYRYLVYDEGAYECVGSGPFYVLGVKNLETDALSAAPSSAFRCAERDWGAEFAFVTGGGASLD